MCLLAVSCAKISHCSRFTLGKPTGVLVPLQTSFSLSGVEFFHAVRMSGDPYLVGFGPCQRVSLIDAMITQLIHYIYLTCAVREPNHTTTVELQPTVCSCLNSLFLPQLRLYSLLIVTFIFVLSSVSLCIVLSVCLGSLLNPWTGTILWITYVPMRGILGYGCKADSFFCVSELPPLLF